MALPKKNSRAIEVDGTEYRYIISRSVADESGLFRLNLTVQIAVGTGCILKAEGIMTRDHWLDFPQVGSSDEYPKIEPRHIASIIRLAYSKGWAPQENGGPFMLEVSPDPFHP